MLFLQNCCGCRRTLSARLYFPEEQETKPERKEARSGDACEENLIKKRSRIGSSCDGNSHSSQRQYYRTDSRKNDFSAAYYYVVYLDAYSDHVLKKTEKG